MFSKAISAQKLNAHDNKFVEKVIQNKKPFESLDENLISGVKRKMIIDDKSEDKSKQISDSNSIKKPKLNPNVLSKKKFKNIRFKIHKTPVTISNK